MDRYDNRIKFDVFKGQTTYLNDFRRFPIKIKTDQDCKRELHDEPKIKSKPYVFQDHQTFANWRANVHIPFNALWRPKEIVNTNPYEPFHTPVMSESAYKEEVVKTRPRIYMSPAVSMDDIDDPEVRKIMCDSMYTSEWTKAIQESQVISREREIPNTTVEHNTNPVQLKIDLLPPLPSHFRGKGQTWENEQLKLTVDPTKTFWEHKEPPVKCGACFDPVKGLVAEETKQEIRELIKQDRLRLPHDAPIPGYAGHKPAFTGKIPLAKQHIPVVHPSMTVSQAITKRYKVNKSE